jgi:hypothetical protein
MREGIAVKMSIATQNNLKMLTWSMARLNPLPQIWMDNRRADLLIILPQNLLDSIPKINLTLYQGKMQILESTMSLTRAAKIRIYKVSSLSSIAMKMQSKDREIF